MNSTISVYCGSGSIETVLLGDKKSINSSGQLTTMQFLCRSRRPHYELSLEDISQYPLLDTGQLQHEEKDPSYAKPNKKYDSRHSSTSAACSNLLKHQEQKLQVPQEEKSSSRGRTRRPSSLLHREKPPAPPRPSYTANNKDIAMAWMQMGKIKPLKPSTRHNTRLEVSASQKSSKRSSALVESIPGLRLNVPSRSIPTRRISKSTAHNKRKPPPPPPPPLISHCRRFRVCFGVMSDWKSAVDPNSGRTYYFNGTTMETQWRKPMELASDEERTDMEQKERKQKAFFANMEANIIKSMAAGTVGMTSSKETVTMKQREPSFMSRPRIVRTISSMDDTLLRDLVKRTPSITRSVRSSGTNPRNSTLEKIQETSKEFDQSCFDFGNNSFAFDGDESSFNFGVSLEEIQALKELAQISDEMAIGSDDSDMHISNNESFSEQDFTVSLSDNMTFVSDDLDLSAIKKVKEAPFDGLMFSPEVSAKKLTSTTSASMPDIVFTPDINVEKKNLVVPFFGKMAAAKEEEEEPDLRSGLKDKAQLVTFAGKPKQPGRRNSCGTIYVGTTMSAPDKDATIKCICGVFRAHIIAAEREDEASGVNYDSTTDRFRLFNDRDSERKSVAPLEEEICLDDLTLNEFEVGIPSLEMITSFYRDVFTRARMEHDCIIMSLIYVERLIKVTDGLLRPKRSNWRSLLFSCMILSSKVWDDMSMWNGDFSQTCPTGVIFSVQRINQLELAILKALKYKVKVPASEYAKYYFLLRSMLIKSGLGGDDLKTMNPLDVEGAKRLEQVSSSFQNVATTKRRVAQEDKLRSKSMGDADRGKMRAGGGASLEHMMQM